MNEQNINNDVDINSVDERMSNSSFIDDLFDYIDEQEVKELHIDNPMAEGFSIRNEEQANYWIRKVKDLREEKEKIAQQAQSSIESYVKKVQKFVDSSYTPLDRQEEFLTRALQSFAEQERQNNPTKKSIRMIEGTLAFRHQQPEFEYDDEALLASLKADDKLAENYVKEKIEYKPDKTKLKKDGDIVGDGFSVNGVLLAGITVTPRPDKFEIK